MTGTGDAPASHQVRRQPTCTTPVAHVARHCKLVTWCNAHLAGQVRRGPQEKHRHSGIGLHTPASVHYGTAGQVQALRQQALDAAYTAHPERFGHRHPTPPLMPTAAWINEPSGEALIQTT